MIVATAPVVGEKRVTLQGVSWQGYQDILRALIRIGCMPVWVFRSFGGLMDRIGECYNFRVVNIRKYPIVQLFLG